MSEELILFLKTRKPKSDTKRMVKMLSLQDRVETFRPSSLAEDEMKNLVSRRKTVRQDPE